MNSSAHSEEWIALHVGVPPVMMDGVANFLHERGSRGVVLDDENPEHPSVIAYFPRDAWEAVYAELKNYLARLCDLFSVSDVPVVRVTPFKEEEWSTVWKSYFTSFPVGKRLIVTPPWLKPEPYGRQILVIEPADAFGTGTHETTQGCLILLEEAMERLGSLSEGVSLLDVGCGTGIIAIAAVKLGATDVTGVDNDPVAVQAALHNAALNGVEDRVHLACVELAALAKPADIVTANLDRLTLLANRDRLVSLFRRFLIVSGITIEQWEEVREAFLAQGLILVREITRAEWGCGMFHKRS
ncbi:MAG: 50S ribosomal protein L11 methyltransferase [Desulfomonile tiedjei]|nr:50S ribosomal protein L11 methyltransferase [Desulfomonile tiedjei]